MLTNNDGRIPLLINTLKGSADILKVILYFLFNVKNISIPYHGIRDLASFEGVRNATSRNVERDS